MKAAIIVVSILAGLSVQAQQQIFLVGRTIGYNHMYTGDSIRMFGFNTDYFAAPMSPGPTLEMNQGDSVEIEFFNFSQGAPHTIHLHGLDVDQDNDGVPQLSWSVDHMGTGFYRFRAPHAGTYLYHCHVVSAIHVQAGMYGSIIVRPPNGGNSTWDGGYDFDQEHTLFTSELDANWHIDSVLNHEHDTTIAVHMVPVPEYHPQYFLVNGLSEHQLDSAVDIQTSIGAVNYLRMTNIGYYGNRVIFPAGMNAQIIDSDGRPLPTVEVSDTIEIYPGERYGILGEANAELLDSIAIEYFDLNTEVIHDTQYIEFNVEGTFSVDDETSAPIEVTMWPNPTTNETRIEVGVASDVAVELTVFDIAGKRLDLSYSESTLANSKTFDVSLQGFPPAIYLVQLKIGNSVQMRKLVKQ